jgi:hypothetical protein
MNETAECGARHPERVLCEGSIELRRWTIADGFLASTLGMTGFLVCDLGFEICLSFGAWSLVIPRGNAVMMEVP